MDAHRRVLFADDEPAIRTTMAAILRRYGFEVTVASTVSEALHYIANQEFDVLVSDLNIGEPGDGFTVVSAMRRTQPKAITFILTGYPAFETALEAIRQQVDDYLIKPADVPSMVERIRAKLANPESKPRHVEVRHLADILADNKRDMVARWLAAAKQDTQICGTRLTDAELADHLPLVIEEIVSASRGQKLSTDALESASKHGTSRFRQGCTIPAMIRELRLLHDVVSQIVQENLLAANISTVIPEIMSIGETMQALLEESIRAYVHERHAAVATAAGHEGKSILLLSAEPELALLRTHVLQSAGFAVSRADSKKDALRLLQERYDAMVITHSASENDGEFTTLFRKSNPNSPIIGIAKGKWQDLKVDIDFSVSGEEGPEALLDTIETGLNRKKLRLVK